MSHTSLVYGRGWQQKLISIKVKPASKKIHQLAVVKGYSPVRHWDGSYTLKGLLRHHQDVLLLNREDARAYLRDCPPDRRRLRGPYRQADYMAVLNLLRGLPLSRRLARTLAEAVFKGDLSLARLQSLAESGYLRSYVLQRANRVALRDICVGLEAL